jgi:hypothetical protein
VCPSGRRPAYGGTSGLAIAAPFAVALAAWATDARADVSSWFAVGAGGAAQIARGASSPDGAPAFTYSIGVGSSPLAPFVVGLLYRGTTMFGLGTDAGAAVRLATGAFCRGGWGLALDGGVAWRGWRSGDYGDSPLQGVLTLGAPWGFQLAVGTQLWTLDHGTSAQGGFAAIELDLLRLTVMRQGAGERWWPNPNPAGGREKQVSLLAW